MILKLALLPLIVIFGSLVFLIRLIVWNEPFRTWEMDAQRRQGKNCRPWIDDNIQLQRSLREMEYENRKLREKLDEERRKRSRH
jgi:hypothetical protein